jgi:hypothetical protein
MYPRGQSSLTSYSSQHHTIITITVIIINKENNVALGGVVVSVLATGPKVRGCKPGRGRWILRVIKSVARLPSEGK